MSCQIVHPFVDSAQLTADKFKGLSELYEYAIICPQIILSGRSAVRLARLHGVQEVGGSNPLAPTISPLTSSSSL